MCSVLIKLFFVLFKIICVDTHGYVCASIHIIFTYNYVFAPQVLSTCINVYIFLCIHTRVSVYIYPSSPLSPFPLPAMNFYLVEIIIIYIYIFIFILSTNCYFFFINLHTIPRTPLPTPDAPHTCKSICCYTFTYANPNRIHYIYIHMSVQQRLELEIGCFVLYSDVYMRKNIFSYINLYRIYENIC